LTNQEDTLDELLVLAVLVYVCFHHLCVVIKHVCSRTPYSHLLSIDRPNIPVVSSRRTRGLASQGGSQDLREGSE